MIAITGIGSINALGIGSDAFGAALRAGRSGIGPLTRFDSTGYRSHVAAEVGDVSLADRWLTPPLRRRVSRSDTMALIAADEALRGWTGGRHDIGVVLGASTGGMFLAEEALRRQLAGERGARASMALSTPVSTSGDLIASVFGCYGPRLTVSTACSSGANALGLAADWILSGRANAVLCGGSDSLCKMTYSGFNCLQALDPEACRPFDRERAGLTLGEGAAMLLLEDSAHAAARGAKALAYFLGYGVSADAFHITQPRPDASSAHLAFQRALTEAHAAAEEIDYVNAHGTATPANDATETRALKLVFGARAWRVPVSSTKAMTGHCLAAAGAIEAVACVLALRGDFVPPTLGLEHPDPECDLDYVPNQTRSLALRTVASSSYGFGGNNTTILLRRADG